MKKLMTMMLALSFLSATVGVMFAQETKQEQPKNKKKVSPKKKGTETPKKQAR